MTEPDAEHLATIDWTRGKWSHVKGKYAREHTWHLAGGTKLKATDAGALLPNGYRDKAKLNPENLFVDAKGGHLSSDAIQRLVKKYTMIASKKCPSLKEK